MTFTKLPPMGSSQSTTTLPPIESKHRKRAVSSIQRVTIATLKPISGIQRAPCGHQRATSGLPKIASDCHALMKQYEDLLNEQMKNEALIEKKEKEIEDQLKVMDNLFEQSDKDRIENEKATRIHSNAIKMLNDIQTEIARAKIRESEQELELTGLENTNLQKRQELRRLTDDITELQKRIERGPDFLKEEIERFIDVIASMEMENEDFNMEIKRKAAELNDLRIELIMKDSDSESEEYDDDKNERQTTVEDGHTRVDILKLEGSISPYFNIKHNEQVNEQSKPDLNDLNDKLTLPLIRNRDTTVNKCIPPVLKPRQVLPVISGVQMNIKSNNPTEFSRNILHRGTTESTKMMGFLPKPPAARLPTVGYRRRRANKF